MDLVAALDKPPRSLEEAEAASKRVDELALALGVADELQIMAERIRRERRRRAGSVAVVVALLAVVGSVVALDFLEDFKKLDAECAASSDCEGLGRCRANPKYLVVDLPSSEACLAKSDGDCAGPCTAFGSCSARNGECIATNEAYCAASDACRSQGWCHLVGDECAGSTDADCLASDACRRYARCSSADGRGCRVELDRDCAVSAYCRDQGECVVLGGLCVRRAVKACRLGKPCEVDGLCVPADDGTCAAGSDSDCAFSDSCQTEGRCRAKDGACVAGTDRDCARSDACEKQSRCVAKDGRCVARNAIDE